MLCLGPWTWVHRSFCCNFFEKEIWSQYFVHNWEFIFSKFVDNQFIFKEVTTKRSMDQSLRTQDWPPSVLSLRRLCYVHFIALRLLFLFAIYLHIGAGITRLQLMTKWGFFETQYICVFIHRVSKKLCQIIFCFLSVKYEPISTKIGRTVLEQTLNKTVPKMPTSPKVCACTTLGKLKCQNEPSTQ